MIESALADVDELAALPGNPKQHSISDIDASMGEFGFLERIVINRVTGHIISGHGRTETLRGMRAAGKNPPENVEVRDGHWFAPVDYVELPAAKEASAALTLNRTVELAGYDDTLLADMMAMIRDTPDVPIIGWSDAEVEKLISVAEHDLAAPGDGCAEPALVEKYQILVECDSEPQQVELLERLTRDGIACRSLIS